MVQSALFGLPAVITTIWYAYRISGLLEVASLRPSPFTDRTQAFSLICLLINFISFSFALWCRFSGSCLLYAPLIWYPPMDCRHLATCPARTVLAPVVSKHCLDCLVSPRRRASLRSFVPPGSAGSVQVHRFIRVVAFRPCTPPAHWWWFRTASASMLVLACQFRSVLVKGPSP